MNEYWTKEEIKEHRKNWIDALRSGKYKQGRGALCLENELGQKQYCCLGVACEVAKEDLNLIITKQVINIVNYNYNEESDFLPNIVAKYYGLKTRMGTFFIDNMKTHLTELNDDECLPFEEIANIIENNPKDLFND